jgi:hypothetical protein
MALLVAGGAFVGFRALGPGDAPSSTVPRPDGGEASPVMVSAPSLSIPDGGATTPSSSARLGGTVGSAKSLASAGDPADSAIQNLQNNIRANLPAHKATFKKLCGFDIDVDIDWASFGQNKTALESFWSNRGVEGLVTAFKGPCNDPVGKSDVKAKIQRIRAINVPDKSKAKASVSAGAFIAELDWSSGAPALSTETLAAIIEKSL